MAKAYFENTDKGSSFYDMSQGGTGVVADRIAPLEITAKVAQAERDGQIKRVEKTIGKERYEAQKKAIRKQLEADAKKAGVVLDDEITDEEVDEESTDSEDSEVPAKKTPATASKGK